MVTNSETVKFLEVVLAKIALYIAAIKQSIATQATMHYCIYIAS